MPAPRSRQHLPAAFINTEIFSERLIMSNQQKLLERMRQATQQLMRGAPREVTAVIQKALHGAGLMGAGDLSGTDAGQPPRPPAAAPTMRDINPPPAGKPAAAAPPHAEASASTSKSASASAKAPGAATEPGVAPGHGIGHLVADLLHQLGVGRTERTSADAAAHTGNHPEAPPARTAADGAQFLSASFSNPAGTRAYKLYVPSTYNGAPLPLVVMLHGCTQDPDDFAAGTQMNAAAEAQHCLVLYPQQSKAANSSRCWNWFTAADQRRDSGEPSIIAGMTREVMAQYPVDPRQVYVAGLSAGGAMAAIMGTTYPDLYAGVAVHSGLPYGAATDLPSALAAMRGGMGRGAGHATSAPGSAASTFRGIPIIVFHGDADRTVHARNGEQVIAGSAPASSAADRTQEAGKVVNGHAYTRTVQHDANGKAVSEHWLIHGFGHAWAGGSAKGSYTDARGPDATGEMMRFFYTHAQEGAPA